MLLTKLNTVHLTLTEHSKRNLINLYGEEAEERILKAVSAGNDGKLNGDNLDIRVQTNDVRLSSKDKDYHFFASDFTIDRVNLTGLSKVTPSKENINLSVKDFVPSQEEYTYFTDSLKLLIARDLLKLNGFKWMKGVVPLHIPHDFEEDMAKKSKIFVLPVSLNNESSYQDCIHIMDEYEQYINRWYSKTGRGAELSALRVPVGGDQLTRVRLEGAKSLRAGAHTTSERFDHLDPVIIEMFHTLQDYLEKLCKKFLDFGKARDPGTLANLKIAIQRVNVNGNVKSRFKAHEDFIITCGTSYLYSYILSKFNMETLEDFPKHPAIKESINMWTVEPKRKVFNKIMDEVLSDLFIPFEVEEPDERVTITVQNQKFEVAVEHSAMLKIPLIINNARYTVAVSTTDIRKGVTVQVGGVALNLKSSHEDGDNTLKTYAVNFLQWYFSVIQMKDAIREGDMRRVNITLKHMVPFFYSHSVLSKYMVECIDYILKTEHTLSPYMSLKVRAATFVNPKGRKGKNKAADMQKENEVKYLKNLIRSLGANKTEKSIVGITKAGPVMLEIAENFDEMTGSKTVKTTHKLKSKEIDIEVLTNKLVGLRLWDQDKPSMLPDSLSKSPFAFDRKVFKTTVMSKIQRLLMDVPTVENDNDE
ncbi:uncharacterized protein LOC127868952 [Dreissena polymorpha]|nr:uncharacterized protein LOC127834430 [Dreissena polymorpha]XP_052267131.1 uncharacterized protein LOC127868952 [Dreissena polymorpha]